MLTLSIQLLINIKERSRSAELIEYADRLLSIVRRYNSLDSIFLLK